MIELFRIKHIYVFILFKSRWDISRENSHTCIVKNYEEIFYSWRNKPVKSRKTWNLWRKSTETQKKLWKNGKSYLWSGKTMAEFSLLCPMSQFIFVGFWASLSYSGISSIWTSIFLLITFSVLSLSICVGSLILDTICPVKLDLKLYLQYPMYDQ